MHHLRTVAIALAAVAVGLAATACDPITTPDTDNSTATVTSTEFSRDGTTGTHYADCRTADGTQFKVVISADQDYGGLNKGDRCPDGPRSWTPPGEFDTATLHMGHLRYHGGGSPHSACGAWEAADKADADEMAAEYRKCVAAHGH